MVQVNLRPHTTQSGRHPHRPSQRPYRIEKRPLRCSTPDCGTGASWCTRSVGIGPGGCSAPGAGKAAQTLTHPGNGPDNPFAHSAASTRAFATPGASRLPAPLVLHTVQSFLSLRALPRPLPFLNTPGAHTPPSLSRSPGSSARSLRVADIFPIGPSRASLGDHIVGGQATAHPW